MTQPVKELRAILKTQAQLLADLTEAAGRVREALKGTQAKEIFQVCSEEEFLAGEMARLEQARQRVEAAVAEELSLTPGASLPAICQALGEEGTDLAELGETMAQKIQALAEINQTNELLARQGMGYATQVLNALAPQGKTYQPDGRVNVTGSDSLLNLKV